MQKTRTLDFCLILEGEITLVLDTAEVQLAAGDTVVQRGTNHAWSNRSDRVLHHRDLITRRGGLMTVPGTPKPRRPPHDESLSD